MRNLKIAVLAGLLLLAGAGVGWVAGRIVSGSYVESELAQEELEFRGYKTTVTRRVVLVPADYGELVAVTPRGEGATLWFSGDGTLRNVSVESGAVRIDRVGSLAR